MRGDTLGRCGSAFALLLGLGALALPLRGLATTANDLCQPSADPCIVSTLVTVTDGSVIDVGQRELRINAGGALDVASGVLTVRARLLTVQAKTNELANGLLRARPTSVAAPGGTLTIQVDQAGIAGSLDANGGPGGQITLTVSGALTVTGTITARSLSTTDIGGTIDITAGTATINGTLAVFGGPDAIGGDIGVDTSGTLTVNGTIDATGGDGGTIDLHAGSGLAGAAGDVVIGDAASLKVDATTAGNFGGTIDLAASGDGTATGRVSIGGLLTSTGRTGGDALGGGDGGCISVSAKGDIRVTRAAARLVVDAGAPDGNGGEVELISEAGAIEVLGSMTAISAGAGGTGGAVTLDAARDVVIAAPLLANGGDGGGGEITASSSAASVQLTALGSIDVSATASGQGGSVCLESGSSTAGTRSIVVDGGIAADGGGVGGAGGMVELSGTDSVRISASGTLRAVGALGGGRGGSLGIAVDQGPALIDGPLLATGAGPNGAGGTIAIDASQRVAVNAPLDARGFGLGGAIGLASTGAVDVRRSLLASSSAAGGGTVEITSQGAVLVAATLNADGATTAGHTRLLGCAVTICGLDAIDCPTGGLGMLSSRGSDGVNRITGRDSTLVLGTLRADNNSGRNELVYNGSASAEPAVLGSIIPSARILVDASVLPCPSCGNRMKEPPETCDDGNQLDGDGCSATCQVEAPLPGDANNDFVVGPEDAGFAVAEIFDGDGDTVGTVSGGAFAGGPGADANGDSRVTAADLTAILRLLAP